MSPEKNQKKDDETIGRGRTFLAFASLKRRSATVKECQRRSTASECRI